MTNFQKIVIKLLFSLLFWSQLNKSDTIDCFIKHIAKFKEPYVMYWNFTIYFQHVRIKHHHLSNRNFISWNITVFILSALIIEWSNKHYRTSFRVCWYLNFSILICYVSILSKFVKFNFLLCIVYILYVLFDFFLIISDIILQYKMNKSMTHCCLCQY